MAWKSPLISTGEFSIVGGVAAKAVAAARLEMLVAMIFVKAIMSKKYFSGYCAI